MKKICPNCGSPEINYASLQSGSGEMVGIGLPAKYYCQKCGYCGSVIFEMNEKQCKKTKFSDKPYHSAHHRSVEAMKPVFTITLLLFMITAALMLIPKYEITKAPVSSSQDTSHSIDYFPLMSVDSYGENANRSYEIMQLESSRTVMNEVDNALGLTNVSGFLVPAFFLFFVSGIMVLMVMNHYRRSKVFS